MPRRELNEQPVQALQRVAEAAGMSRRRFMTLLTAGGAAAVLTACESRVTTTPSPSPTASPSPTPTRNIQKPTPGKFFTPLGTNAETRLENLAAGGLRTPNGLFFVRSHTSSPIIDPSSWSLNIEGNGVSSPVRISYDSLLSLPTHTVTRYVECAGNGRSFFDTVLGKPAQGGQWRLGAYGVAEWTGVRLRDLLDSAGISASAVDVMPVGMDSTNVERPMPAEKAMADDTLVAYMMNGDLIPVDHGFPARVIVPGWVGVNSVKWVGRIVVSNERINTEKNTTSYVLIGPDYQPSPPAQGPLVTTQVIKSAVCMPWPAVLRPGQTKVTGLAWSPFGTISKVEVSLDKGRTFDSASLVGPNIEAAGTRWEYSFNAAPGMESITPRATDTAGNTQYDVSQQKWNQLGYLFGAMVPHPVDFQP
jgi:DMSO/TMAO reductase YedYZ molybdopterin-dependent catalytic subunit